MGLFKKKEAKQEISLPQISEQGTQFSPLPDIPESPPGLQNLPKKTTLPELPNPIIQQKPENIPESLQTIQRKPLPYPEQDNSEPHQFDFAKQITYPITEPTRRKEIEETPEPKRTKEIDYSYEPENFEPPPQQSSHSLRRTEQKKAEPIFIRLDKFETAIEAFNEIKSKIIEIEDLLKKTKEIKSKEEEELISWEHEMQSIKMKIDSVDKNIFSKLD